jgi:hypothetical protein
MAQKKGVHAKEVGKEPVFIIRPAVQRFGLDYLHISLIVLVVILIALAFSLSMFKEGAVLKDCQYGIVNGTCAVPAYNSSQALASAERSLASYAMINTSLSLLPYYSLVNQSRVSYLQGQGGWLVVIPYINPLANDEISNLTMLLYPNLSLESSSLETIKPIIYTNNSVPALGVVSLYSKAICSTSKPVPVYMITDPYAPGAIQGMYAAVNASKRFGGSINMSYYFIFGGYSSALYSSYGTERTQQLGEYLSCASRQQDKLEPFLANLSIIYSDKPISNYTLDQVVDGSGMNASDFNACLANVTVSLDNQAKLAGFYNVATVPEFITDCKYSSIPQTVDYAINYTLSSIKG